MRQSCGNGIGRIDVAIAAAIAVGARDCVLVKHDTGVEPGRRHRVGNSSPLLRACDNVRKILRSQQIQRIGGRQRIHRRIAEIGPSGNARSARRARRRQYRLIGADGKQRRKLLTGQGLSRRHVEGDVGKRPPHRVEHRLDRDRGLVIEQHDQPVANPHKGQPFTGNVGEIHAGVAIEMDGHGLPARRLLDLQILGRQIRGRGSRIRQLGEHDGSIHRTTSRWWEAAGSPSP